MAKWPFRRSRDAAPSGPSAPVDGPVDGPPGAVEPPGWAALPAMSGSFHAPAPTFKTGATVTEDLVAWRSPRLSGAMSHSVSPDGPSGQVAGLLAPVDGGSAPTGPGATGSTDATGPGGATVQRRADVDLVLAAPPAEGSDLPGPVAPRVLPADTTFSAPARPVDAPAPAMPLRRLPIVSGADDHSQALPERPSPAADVPAPVQREPEAMADPTGSPSPRPDATTHTADPAGSPSPRPDATAHTADPAGSPSPRPDVTADMADLAIFQRPRRDRTADSPSVQRSPEAAPDPELPVARPPAAGSAPATPDASRTSGGDDAPLVAQRALLPGGQKPDLSGPTAGSATSPGSGPAAGSTTNPGSGAAGSTANPGSGAAGPPANPGSGAAGSTADPGSGAAAPVVQRRPVLGEPLATRPATRPTSAPLVQRRTDDLIGGTGAIPVPSALPLGTGTTPHGDSSAGATPPADRRALQREPLAGAPNAPGSASLPLKSSSGSASPGQRGLLHDDPAATLLQGSSLPGDALAGAGPTASLPLGSSPHGAGAASTLPLSTSVQREILAGDGRASASPPNAHRQLSGSSGSTSPVDHAGEAGGPGSAMPLTQAGQGGLLAAGSGSAMPLTQPGQGGLLAGGSGSSMPLTGPGRGGLLGGGAGSTLPQGTTLQRAQSAGSPGTTLPQGTALPREPGPTLPLSTSPQRGLLGGDGLGSTSSLGDVVAPPGPTALPLSALPLQRERPGYRAVPMDLQLAAGPTTTAVDTAPGLTYTTTLQRTEDTAAAPPPPPPEPVREVTFPPPPPTEAPAPPPTEAAKTTDTPADLDDLAHKLYDRIRWRLRAELRRDMERAGLGAGVRR